MAYFETSAKMNKNVKEVIIHIMEDVYEHNLIEEGEGDDSRPSKL